MSWQRLRYGWRELRAHPGVAAGAILTLALGIGGSTTMYSVMSGIGSGVASGVDADRVGRIVGSNPRLGTDRGPLSVDAFLAIRAGTDALEEAAAFSDDSALLDGEKGASGASVAVTRISPGFFSTLGFTLSAGRPFREDECRSVAAPVVIVSERFCARRWPGGMTAAIGQTVSLGGEAHTVVGVLPDRLWFGGPGTDLYAPVALEAAGGGRSPVFVVGRLRPRAAWSAAQVELLRTASRIAKDDPEVEPGWTIRAIPLREDAMKRARFGLLGVLGPAVVVLLIACGNVAHLLLARGSRREREMAIRAALGAGRFRLVVERLAESAWIAALAGLLGLAFALWGTAAARAWIDRFKPGMADAVRHDTSSLAFVVGLTVLTPPLFGLLPALRASKPNLAGALHGTAGQKARRRGAYGGRDLLVILEMALAVVLVATAGLFAAFFWELNHIEQRYDASRLLAVQLDLSRATRAGGDEQARRLVASIVASVRSIPGVREAAAAQMPVPIGGRPDPRVLEGCVARANAPSSVPVLAVGDGYFAAIGLPILRGRGIERTDVAGSPPVAVVSESVASRCWPGLDAVGRRVRVSDAAAWATVVGVVRDPMASHALAGILPMAPVFLPAVQRGGAVGSLLVRAEGDALSLAHPVRDAIRAVDRNQPVAETVLLADLISRRFVDGWMLIGLMNVFAALALALAAVGVFGVTSYSVAERTREFGIRVAMGATPAGIIRMVTGQALGVVAIGAVLAALGTAAVTRVMWAELLVVGASSWLGFASIAAVIGLVALAACVIPARRATRVDPVVALRAE